MKNKSPLLKKSEGLSFNPFIIMLIMVLACAIASYVVTPGAYDRENINGVTRVLADSYHAIEKTPVSLLKLFTSIPEGLTASASTMFAIMIIGGVVNIYNETHVISAGVNKVLKIKGVNSKVVLTIVLLAFYAMGGILGWGEHVIPFIPIAVSLAVALGYDPLVGAAISGMACQFGFALGPFNVYTVGTSHTIAELPMFSGWAFRLCILIGVFFIYTFWVLKYAKKVQADPSYSFVAGIDSSDLALNVSDEDELDTPKILSIIVLAISFGVVVYGLLNWGWTFTELSAVFIMGGLVTGLINHLRPVEMINMLIRGMKGSLEGALIVGFARAVQITLSNGGLIDPLVHGLAKLMSGSSAFVCAIIMFLMVFIFNFFMPSGSGKAAAIMPIMVPLADMVGLNRQIAVLCYQFGDGISNTFWFTNGLTLICLAAAKVPLKKWYKFIMPLEIIFFVMQIALLGLACIMDYGPF